jgi:hypothetical protein
MVPYRAPAVALSPLGPGFLAELVAELEPGERVLWTAAPERRALVRRALGELLMPVCFNGFVLALIALCSHDGGSLALSAVPLLALGLPLFQAPLSAWQAMQTTFYAVTDRRALVFEADSIASVDRRDIVRVQVRLRHAGRAGASAGDVALHVQRSSRGAAFVGLRDAPAVAAMLRYDGGRGPC